MDNPKPKSGSIEVIAGSMFSGKTEELIRRLRRAQLANQKVRVFRSNTDTRSANEQIVSHNQTSMHAHVIAMAEEILKHVDDSTVVGIDEGQFFDDKLPEVCNLLANKGIRVLVAGLDMDFKGEPFGPMPAIMAMAEQVSKIQAICVHCGENALYSVRTTAEKDRVVIGASDHYKPLCRKCYNNTMQ